MEAFTGHKTDTIWFQDTDKIVHKWTIINNKKWYLEILNKERKIRG